MEDNRVTVREAAILLGISEGAVRKRVDRGTIRHDKGTDGRVYVYLPAGVHDGIDASNTHESTPLISEMRDRIGFLEEELRRKDAILLNMTEAMKALNPPPEPRDGPETASEERDGTQVPPEQEKPVSWWRRIFGA